MTDDYTPQETALLTLLRIKPATAQDIRDQARKSALLQLRGQTHDINLAVQLGQWFARSSTPDHLSRVSTLFYCALIMSFGGQSGTQGWISQGATTNPELRLIGLNLSGQGNGLPDEERLLLHALLTWLGQPGLASEATSCSLKVTAAALGGCAPHDPDAIHAIYRHWCAGLSRDLGHRGTRAAARASGVTCAVQLGAELHSLSGLRADQDWWPADVAAFHPDRARVAAQHWLHLQAPADTWVPSDDLLLDQAGTFTEPFIQAYEDASCALSRCDDPVWNLSVQGTPEQRLIALGIYGARSRELSVNAHGTPQPGLALRLARSGMLDDLASQMDFTPLIQACTDANPRRSRDNVRHTPHSMRLLRRNWPSASQDVVLGLGLSVILMAVSHRPATPDLIRARAALTLRRQAALLYLAAQVDQLGIPEWAVNELLDSGNTVRSPEH